MDSIHQTNIITKLRTGLTGSMPQLVIQGPPPNLKGEFKKKYTDEWTKGRQKTK